MKMPKIFKYSFILSILILGSHTISAQCATWIDFPNKEDAENAHSIYRQALKSNDYNLAFEQWQIAYDLTPAADGKRDYHFTDGVKIYLNKLTTETDNTKKAEYKKIINRLYDEAIACYEAGTIVTKTCYSPETIILKKAYLRGRQAYDMYYNMRTPYVQNLAILKESVDLGGNNSEYIIMSPYAGVLVGLFEKGKVAKEDVVIAYDKLNAICDYNIENNKRFSTYFKQSKDAMNSVFSKIEHDIFDCAYFVKKFTPVYEADPTNIDQLKIIIAKFKKQNCSGQDDPFIAKLEGEWATYVAKHNEAAQAEFDANNPAAVAKKLYDAGNYKEAIAKYREVLDQTTDNIEKSKYEKTIASILFRKLGKYNEARSAARRAAKLNPGWGAPYMLIGDMYGKSARSCGDSWNQRLAILAAIDKYRYAKSLDSSISKDANKRINTYSKSLPSKEDIFQRGLKTGQTVTVGCWIGESVKIRTN